MRALAQASALPKPAPAWVERATPTPHGHDPARVGRYEVVERLGAGGMANVYLGRAEARLRYNSSMERLVAVKVLHGHLAADEGFVEMFLHEAQVAARLQHSNVVSTLDVGLDDGELYSVMDYIEGDTLAAVQATATSLGRGVPLGIVLRVAIDALSGLDAAHELRGDDGRPLAVVHRDVTPQNVLIGVDGIARLSDFGIARARGRLTHTTDGMLKGKLAYMAPEQLEGGEVDRRADVFAMGVTLWETLALRRLYPGRITFEQARKNARAPYRPLAEFHRALPPELDGVCARALAVDPTRRFATAADFADALEHELGAFVATPAELGSFIGAVAREKLERERASLRRVRERASVVPPTRPRPAARLRAIGAAADASVLEPIPLTPRRRRSSLRAPTLPGSGFFPAATSAPEVDDEARTREMRLSDAKPTVALPVEAPAPCEAPRASTPKQAVVKPRLPPSATVDPDAWKAEVLSVAVFLAVMVVIAYVVAR